MPDDRNSDSAVALVFDAVVQSTGRFFHPTRATTRSGPHVRDANSVQRVWNYFVIASLPAWLIGLWNLGHQTNLAIADLRLTHVPGWRASVLNFLGVGFNADVISSSMLHGLLYFVPIFLVALLTGAVWQALFATVRGRPLDDGLLYCAWFFSLIVPATTSLPSVMLGMTFGIVVGKLIYGGSGRYLVNPAVLGLVFLLFSYPTLIFGEGAWVPVDGYDQPTVLELVADEGGVGVIDAVGYSWWQLFVGARPGPVGVTSVLGTVIGALFLIVTGMASWRVILGAVVGMLGTVLLFNAVAPDNPMFSIPWYWHLVMGGFMFGAVFMATDPVAGATTTPGRWGFGLLVGVLTILVRVTNPSYHEGVMFAILLASVFSPLIDFVVVEQNIRRRARRLSRIDDGQ